MPSVIHELDFGLRQRSNQFSYYDGHVSQKQLKIAFYKEEKKYVITCILSADNFITA